MATTDLRSAAARRVALVATSLLVTLALLELGLRAGGWILTREQRRANARPAADEAIRILCLGESTTQNGPHPWPEQLERILSERVPERSFRVFNEAVGGTTTALILARLEPQLERRHPHLVITMMGINDRLYGAGARWDGASSESRDLARPRILRLGRILGRQLARYFDDAGGSSDARPLPPAEWARRIRDARDALNANEREGPERVFRDAVEHGVRSPEAYWGLASILWTGGQPEPALPLIEHAIALAPDRLSLRADRAELLEDLRREPAAREARVQLQDLRERYPRVAGLRGRAVRLLDSGPGDLDGAAAALDEASRLAPERADLLLDLHELLVLADRSDEAERVRQRLAALAPDALAAFREHARRYVPASAAGPPVPPPSTTWVDPGETHGRVLLYVRLGRAALARERPELAAWAIAHAIALDPARDDTLMELDPVWLALDVPDTEIQRIYAELGYAVQARRGDQQAPDLDATRHHYRLLNAMLAARGIVHVAMQYPTLPLADLRALLGPAATVTYVSNEANFVEALAERGYDGLFLDRFGGTFGHSTALGNRLIAEQAADAVIAALGLAPRTARAPGGTP